MKHQYYLYVWDLKFYLVRDFKQKNNFTQFIMNLAYHVDIVFILLWFSLCFISWKLYSRISWFCVPDYGFFYCRRWNISIKCIIYFDLWLFFCSNNYLHLCYIYKELGICFSNIYISLLAWTLYGICMIKMITIKTIPIKLNKSYI